MRLIVPVTAGVWLFGVGVQGVAFLVKYGMLPFLPPAIGRLDFTPQYTMLMGLVVVGAIVARGRWGSVTISKPLPRKEAERFMREHGGQE